MSTNAKTRKTKSTEKTQLVELAKLKIDDTYQRAFHIEIAQTIANGWNDLAAGHLLGSLREDGSIWLIDGQHRAQAAQMLGKTHLKADVFSGLTVAEEAAMRLMHNFRRNETQGERFKAKIAAGEKQALAIMKICRDFDVVLAIDHKTPDTLPSVSAVETLYEIDDGIMLRDIFRLLKDARGEINHGTASRSDLFALRWLLEHHANAFDRKRMLTVLKLSRMAIRQRAQELRLNLAGSMWINEYRAILEFYNEEMPKAAHLQPVTRGHAREARDTPGA